MFAPTEAQLSKLLSAISLKSTWGKRTYLLICFICHTGMRIGEATRLEVRHVVHEGEARDELHLPHWVVTKTSHARVIPLNAVAQKCVRKLLDFNKERGFSTEERAPLFPWKNHGPLPIREAEREIQKLRERAGLSAAVTPHTFRHFFATRLLVKGVDLPTVQSLLGHRSLQSTQIYTHTSGQRKREAVDRLVSRKTDSLRKVGA